MKSPKPRFEKSSTVSEILARYEFQGTDAPPVANQALGYLALNLPELAIEVLERVTGDSGDGSIRDGSTRKTESANPSESADPDVRGGLEALLLRAHQQNGMAAADLADRVAKVLPRFPRNGWLLEKAILYFCLDERYPEVLGLEERYRDSEMLDGTDLHNVACAAAQTGDYRRALGHFLDAVAEHPDPGYMITDCQLSPLWQHYAGVVPDAGEADLLTMPEVEVALEEAIEGRVGCSVCEYTVRRVLPRRFKPWMERSMDSHFEVIPSAPRDIIHGFRLWVEEVKRKNIRLVRRAIRRGEEALAGSGEAGGEREAKNRSRP